MVFSIGLGKFNLDQIASSKLGSIHIQRMYLNEVQLELINSGEVFNYWFKLCEEHTGDKRNENNCDNGYRKYEVILFT